MAELTLMQFLVALFMGLSAVCFFIWAVLSGMFTDVEAIKYRAYRAEVKDDGDPAEQASEDKN
jgi:cbb3-type cytochrome oxidase maturation protein